MCALLLSQCTADREAERFARAPFGTVRIYLPQGRAQSLALLVSGDGGWGTGIASIAQELSGTDTLVAGVDGREFLQGLGGSAAQCASPGGELARLGEFLIARYHLAPATRATLVGHSAGATLAYVALAQSPPGTFTGALTLSFCSELDLARPLCPAPALRGEAAPSGVQLVPAGPLPGPWIALHGQDDTVCPASAGAAFAAAIPQATFTAIPGVDHNYRDRLRWWPAFSAGYAKLSGEGRPVPGR